MQIRAVWVEREGNRSGFLTTTATHCLYSWDDQVDPDPLKAANFGTFIRGLLRFKDSAGYAKTALLVDSAEFVIFEVKAVCEVSREKIN